ncbi:MAG: YIP1 family protein [Deltaproteobacteria bacterium]|nr:YIP1 family protein [Deltaproteobacteria bacterium]
METKPSLEFGKYLKKSFDIVRLKGEAAQEAAHDERAFRPGILILAIGGLAVAIGSLIAGQVSTPFEASFLVLLAPVLNIGVFSFFIAIFHGFARLLGGKATFMEYYRATSLGWVISWSQAVPVIGAIVSLWSIPMNVVILKSVHKLSTLEACAVLALMMCVGMGVLYFSGVLG